MPVRDQVSKMLFTLGFNVGAITSDTTTNGAIIDTEDYEMGFSAVFFCPAYTDGTYEVQVEEGSASDMSDATDVPDEKIIGGLPTITGPITGLNLPKFGLFSTKRYIRIKAVSTGVTSGATLYGVIAQHGEYLPV